MSASDTTLHELCKGFQAILSRSKSKSFVEQASRLDDHGALPLHTACSNKPPADIVEALLKACPSAISQRNDNHNTPLHQAAMWQASVEVVEVLLSRHPEAALERNKYGNLPLHIAASNEAPAEVVKLLIETYPDALHLQNDDGMTPLDLALSDESSSETVLALLQNRPPPPELTTRQKVEEMKQREAVLERKLHSMQNSSTRQSQDMIDALMAVRKLVDRFPHALYNAGIDPNVLEIAMSNHIENGGNNPDGIILDAIMKRSQVESDERRRGYQGPDDRVEDLLKTIVGLDHIKSQVGIFKSIILY